MLDTFLFDLDGTLIDSIGLIHASYRHALASHGCTEPPYDEWLAGLGTPLQQQFARFQDGANAHCEGSFGHFVRIAAKHAGILLAGDRRERLFPSARH